ncbi:hypothetical protein PilKf_01682 [Pillotina sp. SPG140]|jgi:leucyl aminopeptidase (aminopeptidase T)
MDNISLSYSKELAYSATVAINSVLNVRKGESVLIISNPQADVASISSALYDAVLKVEGLPVLIFQQVKNQLDFAEPAVRTAFLSEPSVVISLSAGKMGKDPQATAMPYLFNGIYYDHIFHYQLYGKKNCRSFWSPGATIDSFCRTVPVDYAVMRQRCAAIKATLDQAVSIHITAPGGTNVRFGLHNRAAQCDDGDFSSPGSGGNLPAGETFISPENGTASGLIVFDGSMSLNARDIIIHDPIRCTLNKGFVTDIQGGMEAIALLNTVCNAETNALSYEQQGKLPAGAGSAYARNARAIGEIGIGLNPEARIIGNMLEDEKAFHTCHFAIGRNYDDDAPALIHLDGLVKNPTIVVVDEQGVETVIEKDGTLLEKYIQ